MILVLGGGVAGLAAGRTLWELGAEFLILEREAEPGGWCRSIRSGNYLFDMSGHFLHLSDPNMRDFFLGLEGVSWDTVERDARVFLHGRFTPYPFQANLYGHSAGMIRSCLSDFASERIRETAGALPEPGNYEKWLVRRFGRSMCREFFFPYNREDVAHAAAGKWNIHGLPGPFPSRRSRRSWPAPAGRPGRGWDTTRRSSIPVPEA